MKQTKEDKEFDDVFEQFSNRELLLNYRRNLQKISGMANSANSRSNENAKDAQDLRIAFMNVIGRIDSVENKMNYFYNLPWYKKLFYKG